MCMYICIPSFSPPSLAWCAVCATEEELATSRNNLSNFYSALTAWGIVSRDTWVCNRFPSPCPYLSASPPYVPLFLFLHSRTLTPNPSPLYFLHLCSLPSLSLTHTPNHELPSLPYIAPTLSPSLFHLLPLAMSIAPTLLPSLFLLLPLPLSLQHSHPHFSSSLDRPHLYLSNMLTLTFPPPSYHSNTFTFPPPPYLSSQTLSLTLWSQLFHTSSPIFFLIPLPPCLQSTYLFFQSTLPVLVWVVKQQVLLSPIPGSVWSAKHAVCVVILVGKRRWCFVTTVTEVTTPFALVWRASLKVYTCTLTYSIHLKQRIQSKIHNFLGRIHNQLYHTSNCWCLWWSSFWYLKLKVKIWISLYMYMAE